MDITDSFRLFSGSSHPYLAQAVADYLEVPLGEISLSRFACKESYAVINETIRGKDVYLLQTCTQNVNDDLMELFIIMDSLKRCSAASVNVIMPYFGYSRQDKMGLPREPISARLIADLLEAVGVDRVVTVDLHSDQIQGFFSKPVDHLTAMPLFVDYFLKKNLDDLVVVSPDTGRAKLAKKMADKLGAELAIMHKNRPAHNVSEIMSVIGNVKDKTVLLVDDMVDTAGSITAGLGALRNLGCREDIYLATTHAVFSGPAVDRLSQAGFKEVLVTDTIPVPLDKQFQSLKVLSIAELLGEVIQRNVKSLSVSSLFA